MFQNYEEALDFIHGRLRLGSKPGLTRVAHLLKLLGNPEKKINAIHIAGTNGKGSTLTFLRSILQESGQRVGSFTSPYIERFNERISLNGEPISDEEVLRLTNLVAPYVKQMDESSIGGPTEFEIVTAMMFAYFGEGHADTVLIEVGIGGTYDSTNVIAPKLSVITTIGLDHMAILGDTLAEIAEQKAGIIKENTPVVLGNIEKEALEVIIKKAELQHSKTYCHQTDFQVVHSGTLPTWGERFSFENETTRCSNLEISMLGVHQIENAGVAIEAALVYSEIMNIDLTHQMIERGVKSAFWAGRMEKILDDPLIVIDGAHNVHAVKRLTETIKKNFSQQNVHILFAALKDKEVGEMIKMLTNLPQVSLTVTTFDFPRAATLSDIQNQVDETLETAPNWQLYLIKQLESMNEDDILLVTGSLYFISKVRFFFNKEDD